MSAEDASVGKRSSKREKQRKKKLTQGPSMRQFSCTVFDQPHRLGGGMFEGRGRGISANNDTEAGVVDMDDAGSDVKGNDIFVDEQKRA